MVVAGIRVVAEEVVGEEWSELGYVLEKSYLRHVNGSNVDIIGKRGVKNNFLDLSLRSWVNDGTVHQDKKGMEGGVPKGHGNQEFFRGHIKSIWGVGRHYREDSGKNGDSRQRKKEAKVVNKGYLKTEITKNN